MPRRRWTRLIGPLIVVGLIVAGIVVMSGSGHPSKITVRGQLELLPATTYQATHSAHPVTNFASSGAACHGVHLFRDIGPGTAVTVVDRDGDAIANGALHAGSRLAGRCVFGFSIPDVPYAQTYGISFDSSRIVHLDVAAVERGADIVLGRR